MGDNWESYDSFKFSSDFIQRYYSAVHRCFELGLRKVAGDKKFGNAIDIACGAGDSSRFVANFCDSLDAVDSSPSLIKKAKEDTTLSSINFILGDFTTLDLQNKYDLVTAVWFHNHLHSKEVQEQMAGHIHNLLKPGGSFAFVVPSSAYVTDVTQRIAKELGWVQSWYERGDCYTKGVFSFAGSEWTDMTVWETVYLMRLYSKYFEVDSINVKKVLVSEELLVEYPVEPTFEVIYGKKLG